MSVRIFKVCLIAALYICCPTLAYALEPGQEMPAIVAQTATGGDFDKHVLRDKVVLVDFWASWCEPCKKSLPWMEQIQNKYQQQGLQILAINLDEEQQSAEAILSQLEIKKIMILFDSKGASAESFGVNAMPSSFLFDKSGKLVQVESGFRESKAQALELKIRSLLGEAK